jgi:gluconate 2-dehydrogenase gamma chain
MADDDVPQPPLGGLDRRTLLAAAMTTLGGVGFACTREAPQTAPEPAAPSGDQAVETFVPVLAALAARLIPSDELGPGAADVDIGNFFRRAFADPRLSTVHPLLKRGCAFVMQLARSEMKQAFTALDPAGQDEIIGRLVENAVRPNGFSAPTFIRIVMALTLEGFLGDPRHGGNKDGLGWRVVGFSPDGRAHGLALKVLP